MTLGQQCPGQMAAEETGPAGQKKVHGWQGTGFRVQGSGGRGQESMLWVIPFYFDQAGDHR